MRPRTSASGIDCTSASGGGASACAARELAPAASRPSRTKMKKRRPMGRAFSRVPVLDYPPRRRVLSSLVYGLRKRYKNRGQSKKRRSCSGPDCESLSEQHDLPHRLAFVQKVEPFVDRIELQHAGKKLAHRQPALPMQRDVARQIAHRHAGADVAALDRALLADEIDDR